LADFAACIQHGAPGVIGDADALASVVVVDCAYQSAAAERWIAVPGESSG
ncbi:MAG: hypothetical protein JNL12_09065, partial [Planctomycetes bacterium]|nr:hypothetical protein [Planctomycetota bacterium]